LADTAEWSLVFECEEEGQAVEITYHEPLIATLKKEGVYVHGAMEFEYPTSGNTYYAVIDTKPCEESGTGQCIVVEATGQTLGDEPVVCRNFDVSEDSVP
jgi:hypothetical protein